METLLKRTEAATAYLKVFQMFIHDEAQTGLLLRLTSCSHRELIPAFTWTIVLGSQLTILIPTCINLHVCEC